MVTREYRCVIDGAFTVKRPISAPLKEFCSICRLEAKQIFTIAPVMGMTGDGIPNTAKDMKEYEGWQRDKWTKAESECHVDNMGTEPVRASRIPKKHTFGKD